MIPELQKHLSPNLVTVDGISIDVNELHSEKAYLPIADTDVGIVIDVNELHR